MHTIGGRKLWYGAIFQIYWSLMGKEITCFLALRYQAYFPLRGLSLTSPHPLSLPLSLSFLTSHSKQRAPRSPSPSLLQQGINTDSSVFRVLLAHSHVLCEIVARCLLKRLDVFNILCVWGNEEFFLHAFVHERENEWMSYNVPLFGMTHFFVFVPHI